MQNHAVCTRSAYGKRRYVTKTLLVMKLTVILLTIGLVNASATGVSQNVSFSGRNVDVEKIFSVVRKQTGYFFFYKVSMLDDTRPVTLRVKDMPVESFLKILFKDQPIDFTIENKAVIISRKPAVSNVLDFLLPEFVPPINIKGKIVDENGDMVVASVVVKGTNRGTTTNERGEFTLNSLDENATLVVSGISIETQEVQLNGNTDITINVKTKAIGQNEVVVVGYGTQKRANLTGAVSTVQAEAFEDRPITNASQALSGQVPGLWVNQVSGQPGNDAANINIRGIGTFGNSGALILVDGIQSSLNNINPNDIESITVLKDASSAAIYGSRAANGVILVVTKSGKKGPIKVELNSYVGRQKATVLPEAVSNSVEMMELYNQAITNEGVAPHYSQSTIDEYRSGTDPFIYPNNDWLNIIIRPADMHEHMIRMSGGTEATQYSASLGFLDQDGIVLNDRAKRYSLNFNLQSKVSERFSWGIRSNILRTERNQSYYGSNSTNMIGELFRSMPYYGTYTADGRYASTWVNAVNAQFNNPLALVSEGLNRNNPNTIVGNAYFNLEILKGLKWNVTAGANYLDNLTEYFIPELFVYDPKSGVLKNRIGNSSRSLTNSYGRQLLTTVFSTLTYHKAFAGDHDLTVLGGVNQEKFNDRNMSAYVEGFLSNSLTEINAGSSNKNVTGTSSAYGIQSVFGRASYAFREKYLFEANLRYDGSSRFSEDNRWGVFPSFSAGWRISEEPFMRTQRIFSNLKIRGSWGKLGNDQIGVYRWIPTLALGRNYPFDGIVSSGVAQTSLANPNITWEMATKTDIGFEAGFLNGKLNIEFDYFNELREDILRNVNMPWTVGALAAPLANLASVRNRGWEFSANYRASISDLHLSAGFNLTYVKNIVTKIPDPQIDFFTLKEGEPMNAFYMWKAVGIFQTQQEVDDSPVPVGKVTGPGDIKFEDISGADGKPDGVIDANDRQVMGKPFPTWTYGLSFSADFRGFDLGILAQGVADVDSYVGGDIFFPFVNGAGISTAWAAGNTWTPDNTGAPLPRLLRYFAPTWNYENNSFWLQDASFLRIKNIQLGYTFPEHLLRRIKAIKGLRLFVNAQNAFTFTKFEGLDPERTLTATVGGQYPNIRILTSGFSLKF